MTVDYFAETQFESWNDLVFLSARTVPAILTFLKDLLMQMGFRPLEGPLLGQLFLPRFFSSTTLILLHEVAPKEVLHSPIVVHSAWCVPFNDL